MDAYDPNFRGGVYVATGDTSAVSGRATGIAVDPVDPAEPIGTDGSVRFVSQGIDTAAFYGGLTDVRVTVTVTDMQTRRTSEPGQVEVILKVLN